MTYVICMVGLPGSGKTHYANLSSADDVLIIDDIKDQKELPDPDVYRLIIITDPSWCKSSVREAANAALASKYSVNINWAFFDNDPESCIKNVEYRNDGRKVINLINELTKIYTIPEGCLSVPVWNCSDKE